MAIEIGLTNGNYNTNYAPLAALFALYRQNGTLTPLEMVKVNVKSRDFSPQVKLEQALFSIMSGCRTISDINVRLKHEYCLSQACGWKRFSEQSNISRSLDSLTQMNIEELRTAVRTIWYDQSQCQVHDWRGFLWLDFDLSGLTCGKQAEKAEKGYFGDKKTL